MTSYQLGNFADAKGHLQNAVSYWNQAIAADQSSGSSTIIGSVAMNVLVGVGVLLAGVAAAVFSFKQSFGSTLTKKPEPSAD